jgi:hypothetical protein
MTVIISTKSGLKRLTVDLVWFSEQKISLPPALTLVSCSAYFFDPEDGGDIFFRDVG